MEIYINNHARFSSLVNLLNEGEVIAVESGGNYEEYRFHGAGYNKLYCADKNGNRVIKTRGDLMGAYVRLIGGFSEKEEEENP